jgi:hypothetical protein
MYLMIIMGLVISLPTASNAEAKPSKPSNVKEVEAFLDAVKTAGGATFDITKQEKQEKKIYDEDGKFLGIIGIEPASFHSLNDTGITPQMTRDLPTGYSNWKVYWYGGGVNFHYYVQTYNSSSDSSSITSYWGKWYSVMPPYTVTSDTMKRYSSSYVEYILRLSSTYGGSWENYLYAFAFGGQLQTGTN